MRVTSKQISCLVGFFVLIGISTAAMAQDDEWINCGMTGLSTATEVNDPLGGYLYTIEVTWDTGVPQAQSHFDIVLGWDLEVCPCGCEFSFGAPDTTGYSNGVPEGQAECLVYYSAEFNCSGDPSIEGFDHPLLKFEPYPSSCEPGREGEGVFWFFSDWPPVPVETPNQLLVMKFDGSQCGGELVGVLPGCDCFAVPNEATTWGRIKSMHR